MVTLVEQYKRVTYIRGPCVLVPSNWDRCFTTEVTLVGEFQHVCCKQRKRMISTTQPTGKIWRRGKRSFLGMLTAGMSPGIN